MKDDDQNKLDQLLVLLRQLIDSEWALIAESRTDRAERRISNRILGDVRTELEGIHSELEEIRVELKQPIRTQTIYSDGMHPPVAANSISEKLKNS